MRKLNLVCMFWMVTFIYKLELDLVYYQIFSTRNYGSLQIVPAKQAVFTSCQE